MFPSNSNTSSLVMNVYMYTLSFISSTMKATKLQNTPSPRLKTSICCALPVTYCCQAGPMAHRVLQWQLWLQLHSYLQKKTPPCCIWCCGTLLAFHSEPSKLDGSRFSGFSFTIRTWGVPPVGVSETLWACRKAQEPFITRWAFSTNYVGWAIWCSSPRLSPLRYKRWEN